MKRRRKRKAGTQGKWRYKLPKKRYKGFKPPRIPRPKNNVTANVWQKLLYPALYNEEHGLGMNRVDADRLLWDVLKLAANKGE